MSSDQEQNEAQEKQTPRSRIKTRDQIDQETGAVSTRRPTPSSILVYVGIVIFIFFYGFLVPGEPSLAFGERLAVTVFLRIMIIFLLINRSTIGWILAILFEISQIILFPLSFDVPNEPKTWGLIFLHTAAMALLLTGATRQHIWARDPEIVAQQQEVGSDQADPSSSESRSSSST
jgi:hypothetical protein